MKKQSEYFPIDKYEIEDYIGYQAVLLLINGEGIIGVIQDIDDDIIIMKPLGDSKLKVALGWNLNVVYTIYVKEEAKYL